MQILNRTELCKKEPCTLRRCKDCATSSILQENLEVWSASIFIQKIIIVKEEKYSVKFFFLFACFQLFLRQSRSCAIIAAFNCIWFLSAELSPINTTLSRWTVLTKISLTALDIEKLPLKFYFFRRNWSTLCPETYVFL